MKIKVLIFPILLLNFLCCISLNAQSRIQSVYGVNLGDSESVVTSKISGRWKTNSKGVRYYQINRPTLGNCTFDDATFWFRNGKLHNVSFSSADGGACDPNFQSPYGGPNGYEQFLAKSERFQRIYRTMHSNLLEKYGTPVIDDDDRAIWKSNGNEIELEYKSEDKTNQSGWHDTWTYVGVIYRKGGSSSNF